MYPFIYIYIHTSLYAYHYTHSYTYTTPNRRQDIESGGYCVEDVVSVRLQGIAGRSQQYHHAGTRVHCEPVSI